MSKYMILAKGEALVLGIEFGFIQIQGEVE